MVNGLKRGECVEREGRRTSSYHGTVTLVQRLKMTERAALEEDIDLHQRSEAWKQWAGDGAQYTLVRGKMRLNDENDKCGDHTHANHLGGR